MPKRKFTQESYIRAGEIIGQAKVFEAAVLSDNAVPAATAAVAMRDQLIDAFLSSLPDHAVARMPGSTKIPKMTCKPGCTDCCGPVPFTASERAAVARLAPLLNVVSDGEDKAFQILGAPRGLHIHREFFDKNTLSRRLNKRYDTLRIYP